MEETLLTEIKSTVEGLVRDVEEVKEQLLGNGQPGLLREVSQLRGQLVELKGQVGKTSI